MIGNYVDAALAKTGPHRYLLSDEGTSRIVYLINGIVYKINRFTTYEDNEAEYVNWELLKDRLPHGVYMPDMSLWNVNGVSVIASEYIDGMDTGDCSDVGYGCECDSPHIPADTIRVLDKLGWGDCAWGNAKWVDGALYLIDVAC